MTDAVREYRDACRAPACSIDREAFNWNRATALLRGRDYLAKYADAAIAELEAKVEELDDKLMEAEGAHDAARRWFEEQKKQFARAEKAEADLAAIESLLDEVEQREARRCGACALWQEWKPGSWDCAEEWCGYSTNPETFGCTHWEQRREG